MWTIHRKIGMSGGLFARALLREVGAPISPLAERLHARHHDAFERYRGGVRPLPGAVDLLKRLTASGAPWAIATSSRRATAGPNLASVGVPEGVPIITRDAVARAKPDLDLFLAGAETLGLAVEDYVVVGDSVWDLLAPAAPGRWGSASCRVATARTSSSAPAPSGSTRTPTSCATSTR